MATNTSSGSITAYVALLNSLIAGLTKDVAVKSALLINGVSMLQPAIIAQLQAILALYTKAAQAQAAAKLAVAAREAGAAQGKQFVKYLIASIKLQFGDANPQLPDFGIALPKPKTPLTAAQKVIAAAKTAASKALTGSKSAKEKADLLRASQSPTVTVGSDASISVASAPPAPAAPAPTNGTGTNGVSGNGVAGH
jgi:hypothetical protein